MATKKFWKLGEDRNVGTAHLNRKGEVVDFRSITSPPVLVDGKGEVVRTQGGGLYIAAPLESRIALLPPPGQERLAETLILETSFEEVSSPSDEEGRVNVETTFTGSFEGVIFSITSSRFEWVSEEAQGEALKRRRLAWEEKLAERQVLEREREARVEELSRALSATQVAERVSRSEAGQVRAGRKEILAVLFGALERILREEFPGDDHAMVILPAAKKAAWRDQDLLIQEILRMEDERQAAKKAQWEARQTS